jgi:serine protease Do
VQLADIIERVQPAVVNIASSARSRRRTRRAVFGPDPRAFQGTPFDDLLRRFFEMNPNGGPRVQKAQALGSGFIIDRFGLRRHEQSRSSWMPTRIKVTLNDGTEYDATSRAATPATDLALLKIEPRAAAALRRVRRFGPRARREWVVAVGNPSASAALRRPVSSRRGGRDIHSGPFDDYLQIDAPINMGNSGGPSST